jgi:hypothetical protein
MYGIFFYKILRQTEQRPKMGTKMKTSDNLFDMLVGLLTSFFLSYSQKNKKTKHCPFLLMHRFARFFPFSCNISFPLSPPTPHINSTIQTLYFVHDHEERGSNFEKKLIGRCPRLNYSFFVVDCCYPFVWEVGSHFFLTQIIARKGMISYRAQPRTSKYFSFLKSD